MSSSNESVKLTKEQVYRLTGKRFLLVGIADWQVRKTFEAFNLDPEDWGAIHWGGQLSGRAFEKIVLHHPGRQLTLEEERWYQTLRCRLIAPDTEVIAL